MKVSNLPLKTLILALIHVSIGYEFHNLIIHLVNFFVSILNFLPLNILMNLLPTSSMTMGHGEKVSHFDCMEPQRRKDTWAQELLLRSNCVCNLHLGSISGLRITDVSLNLALKCYFLHFILCCYGWFFSPKSFLSWFLQYLNKNNVDMNIPV